MTNNRIPRSAFLTAITIGLVFLAGLARATPSDTGHLVVLMYHRFDAGGSISTPMDEFERQIDYLLAEDYNFVSLKDVRSHLENNRPFPDKSVLITIDDGYESTYTHAYPYLREKDVPWGLYVYTEAIEKSFPSALDWAQIREMSRNGATVGNHTYSHNHPVGEQFRSGQWVQREILAPQQRLQSEVQTPVFSFAIPYGEYDKRLLNVLKGPGNYRVVWGIDPGPVDPTVDRAVRPRYGINGSTSWSEFKKKLRRLPLGVKKLHPEPGAEVTNGGDTIRVTLQHPERYRKSPVNVFFSELGRMEWSWDDEGHTLVVPVQEQLDQDWNRIIVTAYDRKYNRYRYFSRGFPTGESE